jgi:chaperonin GroES
MFWAGICENACSFFLPMWQTDTIGTVLAVVWSDVKYTFNKILSIMNIKPLGDRVLVVPAPAEEKIGGIIIPDTAKEKPLHGTIKAVGQGTKDEEMVLKAGDEVLYGKYSGTELEFEGEKYLMMRQSDVLAVIEK